MPGARRARGMGRGAPGVLRAWAQPVLRLTHSHRQGTRRCRARDSPRSLSQGKSPDNAARNDRPVRKPVLARGPGPVCTRRAGCATPNPDPSQRWLTTYFWPQELSGENGLS